MVCLADGSSTLEELCEHVLLPAEHSKDSWASLKELIPRSRLCTNTWSAGRMPELVLSPGALAAVITRFKASTCLLLITSTGKGRDCSLSASELIEPCPHRKVRSQITLQKPCWMRAADVVKDMYHCPSSEHKPGAQDQWWFSKGRSSRAKYLRNREEVGVCSASHKPSNASSS